MNAEQLSMASDFHPSALADIYQADVDIAIWKRQLSPSVISYAKHLMNVSAHWQTRFTQKADNIASYLERELPLADTRQAFTEDVALVVDMFSCLFELDNVGVRMAVLRSAMCPKFHVDRVPCRLICTYAGAGTQWHPTQHVQRLGNGRVKPHANTNPQHLDLGDVALLKGESWEGNEGNGLVHCSPPATESTSRLVLTLDFA